MSNSFRTATGRCLIDDETLRIERADRGWLANPRDALTSDEVPPWRKAAVIGVFVAVLTGLGLLVRVAPPWLAGAVVGLLLAAVGWSAYAGRKPEGSITIPLDRVVDVEAHSGIPLVTRPRFVVRYRAEGGVKHRYLLCPSRIYGFGAYASGIALFDRRGMLAAEKEGTAGE
ncbi:hypothetical protein [Halolamina sp.]|uniref:hypothetical protein n=1 Tax=Halolamina sp. TaxID=1940283 RepID=UPI0006782E34